jgi:PTS system cellobiose-specific IIA component
MTKLDEIAFDIIAAAGDGRAKVLEGLKQARKGNFGEAADCLKDADVYILKAHQLQTDELLTKQANGELTDPYNVVIAHAQDYVMTAMVMKEMAAEIVKLYEKIRAL